MSFNPTRYEHVPNSGDEHPYTDTQHATFRDDEHDRSHLDPWLQPHESNGLSYPPTSPISRPSSASHKDVMQPLHDHHRGEDVADFQRQPTPSHFSLSSSSLKPKDETQRPPRKARQSSTFVNRLSDWWWWELGSVVLSLACFIAIVVTLLIIQDKALSSWHSAIAPNALISTLATVSKASLMLAVAACISQIKWLYLRNSTRSLHDMQVFDDASRGPLGALELIMRLDIKEAFGHRSGGAGWAFWASILTILALALDPFAQQILSFPLRSVPVTTGPRASISTAQIYDTGVMGGVTQSGQKNVDWAMQGAVMNGLYTLDSPVSFTCMTANCTWPTFYTIGICSSCTNVTEKVNATCSPNSYGGGQSCNYTLPSRFKLSSTYWSSSGSQRMTTLKSIAREGDTGNSRNRTDWLVDTGIIRISNSNSRSDNTTFGTYEHPEAFECRLSWCAKRYSSVNVSNGPISTPDVHSWPLTTPNKVINVYGREMFPFEVAASDFDGPNRTFTINANDHTTLAGWLAGTFLNTSNQEATARALYLQADLPQTFANMATSMTNKIRDGRNGTVVYGTAFREETYIHVTWPWLILPGVVVLMGVVLLGASIVLSRGEKDGLWRNSVLAVLFARMSGWEQETLRVGRWSEIGDQAKSMRGRLERTGQGGLDFVRT
ncbi:hypothetical protein FB567DRAFT_595379 [Paraphoma chrysanthemicola]|uniref:Uncharacterized protein n=1 Tax=Paraphoma chrysanthemicola TaxID=798071 RepID=A0A8K0R103_9PLEO|nr:hypothetical protein FB567DRAFT_595379 [Paraphoma chrysanthemicola]